MHHICFLLLTFKTEVFALQIRCLFFFLFFKADSFTNNHSERKRFPPPLRSMLGRKFSGMFAGTTDLNVEVGSVEAQEIIVSSPFPTALLLFYLEERPADWGSTILFSRKRIWDSSLSQKVTYSLFMRALPDLAHILEKKQATWLGSARLCWEEEKREKGR